MENTFKLIIEADTNDGDYVYQINDINLEQVNLYSELIKAIRNCKFSHNWPKGDVGNGECPPEELYPEFDKEIIERFDEFVPHGEYGIHTIESITLLEIVKETELL